ncbi:phage antirepressor KilAC domain-containing protein [Corynebacterium renale]|uniref:phage antirepressor KilAC domain-containing protein n=1 Tax=Corynebacterium renale TaxID=1724 RepID=UPI001E4F21AA|nr:phage antirepressor KilAC domain-containing protein [Corynebacterium renale]
MATSSSTILVGDLAKILRGNGVDIGANRLFAWLRDNKFLISRRGQDWNMPTQRSMDLGLFQIKETAVTHADGHVTVSKTPKVTGKGQRYFIDKFLGQESSYDGQLELTHT